MSRPRLHRVTLSKSPGNAETITIDTQFDGSDEQWQSNVEPLLALLDARMFALNKRMLKGAVELGALSPKERDAAQTVLKMVNGVELPMVEAS